MARAAVAALLCCAVRGRDATPVEDEALVHAYVARFGNTTFRPPSGALKFPYLVPGGFYQQLWDWDSMLTGTALLDFGSAPYLAGSMKNFFSQVNVSDGTVKGCLTPEGASETIYHAKPVLIQGALIAAQYMNDTNQFRPFAKRMLALDAYWEALSRDAATGLYRWHDQLESGSDNLITSQCPSVLGEGPEKGSASGAMCWVASDAYTLASTDIMVWLHREKLALAAFLTAFGDTAQAARVTASASALKLALRSHLWDEEKGYWLAFNTSSRAAIEAKTHLLALPVFGGPGLVDARDAARAWAALSAPDMLSRYGVRSASLEGETTNVPVTLNFIHFVRIRLTIKF